MYYWLRVIPLVVFDALLINISIYIALWFRIDGPIPPRFMEAFIDMSPWVTLAVISSLYIFNLYKRMWKYTGIAELYGIIKAVATGNFAVVGMVYALHMSMLPRSVYIMASVLMFLLISGSRLGWRVFKENIVREANQEAKNTLIIGAGDAGAIVARELNRNSTLGMIPVGFVDDSIAKQRLILYGIPVMGTRKNIPAIVRMHGIEEIIIAMPSAGGKAIREIVNICQNMPARIRIFQGSEEWLNNGNKIRDIELEDLLRREPVALDLQQIASYLKDKTIMVSGAGGSIGSELCRQLCRYGIGKLIILDNCENNVFLIENELLQHHVGVHIESELCDVKDEYHIARVINKHHPQVVFHAAAYKHVPMMERHPAEALKNNVLGSKNIAKAADQYGVETFVLISTDKAVNPSNVMGATKRVAELMIMEVNKHSKTQFTAVRFGNVLGSRGSVIPTFKKQIEQGGPITVTHPEMTRFFMTIPEAVQLVIQAGAMSRGGEIFVLDMGEPVRIMDLAQDLLRLYGYEVGKDIDIAITGIRPGEKLYEELFTAREQMAATQNERIFISNFDKEVSNGIIERVEDFFQTNEHVTDTDTIALLQEVLPEYHQNH